MSFSYSFKARIWVYIGTAARWHFVGVPKRMSAQFKRRYGRVSRGWNSLPVEVAVGEVVWRTSVFYDSKTATYLLPIKADVRRRAGLVGDQMVSLNLQVLV